MKQNLNLARDENGEPMNESRKQYARYVRSQGPLRRARLPKVLLTNPDKAKADGERLLAELKRVEEDLTKWEEENEELYKMLPWYEAREQYKAQKAAGTLEEVAWYEALAWAERLHPGHLGSISLWGTHLIPAQAMRKQRHLERKKARELKTGQ